MARNRINKAGITRSKSRRAFGILTIMEEPVSKQSLGGLAKAEKMRDAYCANPHICKHCNSPILPDEGQSLQRMYRRVYCSRSCAVAAHNQEKPKRVRLDRLCRVCGQTFKEGNAGRRICDACTEAEARRLEARTKGSVTRRNLYAHSANVMLNAKREKKCQRCGYELFVEICHIKAVSSFSNEALLLEINAPENLIFLCPNCHHEFDAGLLKGVLSINK